MGRGRWWCRFEAESSSASAESSRLVIIESRLFRSRSEAIDGAAWPATAIASNVWTMVSTPNAECPNQAAPPPRTGPSRIGSRTRRKRPRSQRPERRPPRDQERPSGIARGSSTPAGETGRVACADPARLHDICRILVHEAMPDKRLGRAHPPKLKSSFRRIGL
jgi:hypothetical protein